MPDDGRLLDRCRILVVEDDYFLSDDLKRLLGRHGATVIGPLGESSAALRRILNDGIDVAIVDVKLHDAFAYEIADELTRQGTPFGFATGYSPEAMPERFRGTPCWIKPIDDATLLRDLAGLCRASRPT